MKSLTRRVETAQNYLNCFYFASWNRAFYQHSLPLACWWVGKTWKEKETRIALTSPFLLCHHSQSKRLLLQRTNRNRESCDRIPRQFMFLRTTLPFFAFWLGLWILPTILQSRHEYVYCELRWTSTTQWATAALCLWVSNCYLQMGSKKLGRTCILNKWVYLV